ncbi:putative quinol monooxygenase [uncultured Erythrobacter sp.]|uniref:putative quinol monooxygenase n=1 Tax=uncultured Erythrobacter sp. TaxID=263913 RepID=UPI0026095814|nr:putative quinol monooxygenase [uncultured Erythrobacter sp.]
MLIVLAKAKVGDGAIESAREAIATMVEASNAEEGCIDYAFTQDILDSSTMHIVEKWVDDAALVAHFQTPHMAAFQQALASLDVSVTEVSKYQSDEGSPLM